MAVGFVASASSGSQASVASFNIGTLGTGARAGIVFVVTHNSATAVDTGVTWNGTAMTLLYSATDTDTEPGVVRAYFLDNVTNGTITVSRTNNATVCVGYAASISTASVPAYVSQTITRVSSTQNTDANTSTTGTGASGEVAVDDGSPGTNSMRFAAAYSGAATPPAAGTNSTALQVLDSTALGSRFVRETTAGQGSRNVGFATGTTDDWALVAVAVSERTPKTITLGALENTPTLYAPTIAFPTQSVTLGLLDASNALYAPTLAAKNTITLPLLEPAGGGTPAHVQNLGDASFSTLRTSTVLSPVSKTVTVGNTIVVAFGMYSDVTATSVTDNLGNTYTRVERTYITNAGTDLWYAPVTTGGSLTAITVNHPSTTYTGIIAAEFSGVGTLSEAGGGSTGTGLTSTWVTNKTIPANGLAVGGSTDAGNIGDDTAGAASGSPSTTIVLSTDGALSIYGSLAYAIAGSSQVTGFNGTTSITTSVAWAGAGAVFNPAGTGRALYAPTLEQASGGTPQSITLGLLDGANALYAPTLTPQPVTVTLGSIENTPTLYAPTLTPTNAITLALLDGANALYAPALTLAPYPITLPLLDGAATLYAPTVAGTAGPQDIALGLLDGSAALYAPTLAPKNTVSLGLLDGGAALYEPTLSLAPYPITLPLLDGGAALYAPTLAAAPSGISLGLLDAGRALYEPLVGYSLQDAINDATAGSTLNLGTGIYVGPATVNKSLTIIGGVHHYRGSAAAITVTANNVTLDGLTIIGRGDTATFDWNNHGILAYGTHVSHLTGFVAQNCSISEFNGTGMWIEHASSAFVDGNLVTDCAYTGVMAYCWNDGDITNNEIRRIGYLATGAENAYGIAVTGSATGTTERSNDVVVADNLVWDVPRWHAIDTHGGLRISFLRNVVGGSSRGLFFTTNGDGTAKSTDLIVEDNWVLNPYPTTYNLTPITLYDVQGADFNRNYIIGWGANTPPAATPWYDYLGLSTGLTASGNTVFSGNALYPPLLDASRALYAPTLAVTPVTITLGLLDGGAALYAPVLTNLGGGTQTLTLGLLDAGPALYAPSVQPDQVVTLPVLDAGPALYAPTVLPQPVGVTLGLLDGSRVLYAPVLLPVNTLVVPLLDGERALYDPQVFGAAQIIVLDTLDASAALYAPTLTKSNTITLELLDAAAALYAPVVQKASVTLTGITRNQYGAPIGNCTVLLFRSSDNAFIGSTTSDGSGRYTIACSPGVEHFVVAYSAAKVYGTTARDLVGS